MYGYDFGIQDISREGMEKWDELFCDNKHNWDDTAKAFRHWCEDKNVYYYARPREDFSEYEAYTLARKAGCTKIIIEDMS